MKLNKKVDHGSGRKRVLGISAAVLIAGVCAAASYSDSAAVSQKTALDQSGKQVSVKTTLGNLPLAFEPNRGQTSSQAKFLARGEGYSVLLTGNAAVLQLHGKDADNLVRMRFAGSNASPRVHAQEKQAFQTNYFLGADASKWFHVPNYGAVRYDAVYPGVDVLFHGNHRKLQYDFVVGAGADPSQIRLAFDGVSNASVNDRGELVLNAGGTQLRNLKPYIYQERNGVRQTVEGRYALKGSEVAFEIAKYDHSQALVIDPSLAFSTYVGGTLADDLRAVAVDSTGVYVAGSTTSSSTVGAGADLAILQWPNASNTVPIVLAGSNLGLANALVAKLTLTGDGFSYISVFGGTGTEAINGIAVLAGEVYTVGTTSSPNFPQVGSLQAYQKGVPSVGATQDAFFSHLNATGTAFVMSTYVGGGDDESGNAVAVDTAGNAYVAGTTKSANLLYASVVALPFQATINTNNIGGVNTDGFVVRISAANIADYNTYFGGTLNDVINAAAVDSAGMLYLAGQTFSAPAKFPLGPNTAAPAFIGLDNTNGGAGDAFAAKLNPAAATAAAQLVYSTYLGGPGADSATAIAVDLAGQAYVTGTTQVDLDVDGNTFTTSAPSAIPQDPGTITTRLGSAGAGQDIFVAKLNASGSVLKNLTTIEGLVSVLTATGIAVDGQEQVYLSGFATNVAAVGNVPAAVGANSNIAIVGAGDQGFFARFPASLTSLQYLTYTNSGAANSLKENGLALLDSTRDVFIAGTTTAAAVTYTPAVIVSADNTFAGASEGFVFALNFNDAVNTVPVSTAAQLNWTLAQGVTAATLAQRSSKVTITNSDIGFGTLAIPTVASFTCGGVPATVAVSTDNGTTAGLPGIGFKANGVLAVDVTVILVTNPATPTDFTDLTTGNYSCTLVLNTPQTEAGTTTILGNIQISAGALVAVPSSLTFNQVAGALPAAAQTVDIQVTPPAVGAAIDIPISATIVFPAGTATWASVATDGNSAGVGDVTVTPLAAASNLAPGVYTATITVSPALQVLPLSNAPVSITATLVVSSAGLPVLSQLGVFRGPGAPGAALAQFVLDRNANEQFDLGIDTFHFFGLSGDTPVVGDWTGSGVVRMGVFRGGQWYLDLNNNGKWDGVAGGDAIYSFGLPGDIPVVGDWNGNGITKLGVFRCPVGGGVCTWVLDVAGHNAFDSTALFLSYGLTGDMPVAGNWVGGAVRADQIGVFRCPAVGVCSWIVDSNGNGSFDLTDAVYSFGLAGDQPVVGDWNEGGRKRIGVFRGNGTWVLDSNGNNAFDLTDLFVSFGLAGDIPVVGKWPVGVAPF